MALFATIEGGEQVGIGEWVCFKSDVEQSGQIVKIEGTTLVLENLNGFDGDYIGSETQTRMPAKSCWVE